MKRGGRMGAAPENQRRRMARVRVRQRPVLVKHADEQARREDARSARSLAQLLEKSVDMPEDLAGLLRELQ